LRPERKTVSKGTAKTTAFIHDIKEWEVSFIGGNSKALAGIVVHAGCLGFLSAAQEVIHALTGTVAAIDSNNNAKTITVLQDSGSEAEFNEMRKANTPIEFDKKIALGPRMQLPSGT